MGSISREHGKWWKKAEKNLGRAVLIMAPIVSSFWVFDYGFSWQKILAIILSSLYGIMFFLFVLIRAINK